MAARVINNNLYAFVDIVDYSRRTAAQQCDCQEQFVRIIEYCLQEAGVHTESISLQNHGSGALLMTFPVDTDVTRMLAVLPRLASLELARRNKDLRPTSRLRLRMSFSIGPTAPGPAGPTGQAPIEAVRLSAADALRRALAEMPMASLGVIITDDLYDKYVKQEFRSDLTPDSYAQANVRDQETGLDAKAWVSLPERPNSQPAKRQHRKTSGKSASKPQRKAYLAKVSPQLKTVAAVILGVATVITAANELKNAIESTTSGNSGAPAPASTRGHVAPSGLPAQSAQGTSSHHKSVSHENISIPTNLAISKAVNIQVSPAPENAAFPPPGVPFLRDMNCLPLKGGLAPSHGDWTLITTVHSTGVAYGPARTVQWLHCSFNHLWTGRLNVMQGIFGSTVNPGSVPPVGATVLAYSRGRLTVWNLGTRSGWTVQHQLSMDNVKGFFLETDTCFDSCLKSGEHFVWDIRIYTSHN
jgi:hypothetical protein